MSNNKEFFTDLNGAPVVTCDLAKTPNNTDNSYSYSASSFSDRAANPIMDPFNDFHVVNDKTPDEQLFKTLNNIENHDITNYAALIDQYSDDPKVLKDFFENFDKVGSELLPANNKAIGNDGISEFNGNIDESVVLKTSNSINKSIDGDKHAEIINRLESLNKDMFDIKTSIINEIKKVAEINDVILFRNDREKLINCLKRVSEYNLILRDHFYTFLEKNPEIVNKKYLIKDDLKALIEKNWEFLEILLNLLQP